MNLTKYGSVKKESVTFTLRMSPELMKRLERSAKKGRISKNALAVGILTEVLEKKTHVSMRETEA